MAKISFRYRPCQLSVLRSRQFDGESIHDCVIRLFRLVQRKRVKGEALSWEPLPVEHRLKNCSVTFCPEGLALIESISAENLQSKIDGCLELVAGEPPIPAIATAQQALELLQSNYAGRITTKLALSTLRDRCPELAAKELLYALHEAGTLKLIQGKTGTRLGPSRTQYQWCDLTAKRDR